MCGSEPWPEKGHSGADRFRAGGAFLSMAESPKEDTWPGKADTVEDYTGRFGRC